MSSKYSIVKSIKKLLGIQYKVDTEQPQVFSIEHPTIGRNGERNKTLGTLIQELQPHIDNKKSIFESYVKIRPMIEHLLNKVCIDILFKGRSEGSNLISISYPDPDIQEILEHTLEKFKIERNIEESLFDTLLFGEYYQRIDYENSELDDCYDYVDILPVYSKGRVVECIKADNSSSERFMDKGNEIKIPPKDIFITSVSLPGYRIRLNVKDKGNSRYYLRIPSPFIPTSAINLLMSISLMEKLIPIVQLMKLDRGQLVTIPVPTGTPINQMFDICREFENQINSRFRDSTTSFNYENVEDIIATYGRYKVIPSVQGTGLKADLVTKDLPASKDIQTTDFEYLMVTAANRIGVPLSYMMSGTQAQDDPKAILQYLLKVKFIRENIAETVYYFLCNYMNYRRLGKGDNSIPFDKKLLDINLPAVPGTESLNTVDYMDAMTATLQNVNTVLSSFGQTFQQPPIGLDIKAVIEILNDKLRPILGKNIFDMTKLEGPASSTTNDTDTGDTDREYN